MAMLRMTNYTGTIKIDGVDISTIQLSELRSRCCITLPQDPFLLRDASLRINLDASAAMGDEVLQRALAKVGIWSHLAGAGANMSDTLKESLADLPPLSVGQAQLLAFARAMVQKEASRPLGASEGVETHQQPRRILLVDEATCSLDAKTESTIYQLIESEFVEAGFTVLMVAHRLSALRHKLRLDRDMIALLDNGGVKKVGHYAEMKSSVTALEEVE